jgi:hypothetical protein
MHIGKMWRRFHRAVAIAVTLVGAAGLLLSARHLAAAGALPRELRRAFAFPASSASGVTADLVAPAGTTTKLTFDRGMVAIGYLPVPRPQPVGRRSRSRAAGEFVRPTETAPHARLLLSGVLDAAGNPVTNGGNEFVIDAVVSPSSAAGSPPPFVIPFQINNGTAFVDAPLPVQPHVGGAVRVQILGAAVIDPDGQPFGVLGLSLPAVRPTPTAVLVPTPGAIREPEGQCFVGSSCGGPSFAASRERCCHLAHPYRRRGVSAAVSWCPHDQFDPTTGQCAADACVGCTPAPQGDCDERPVCAGSCAVKCPDGHLQPGTCSGDATCECRANCEAPPSPTPDPCEEAASCSGPCLLACADGSTVVGQCVQGQNQACTCSATCAAPTPCSVGQCFDTIGFRCTGQACGPDLRCPLPNQFCDVSGRRCPCSPPPGPPSAHLCCQCDDPTPACVTLSFSEVQPVCPPGCETFVEHDCDPQTHACVPAPRCTGDQDCDDGNGCTIDHCTNGVCTRDCVCVGPFGCGPGPGRR